MKLKELICSYKATIKETMICINENAKGAAFIVNDTGKLIGVVTDGDIRRLLINGYGLNDCIGTYIQKNFIYANINDTAENINKKFNYRIRIVPIVDQDMKLVDYACFDENIHISLAQPQLSGNEYKYLMDAHSQLMDGSQGSQWRS